jgi:hypothetical protein
MSLPFLNAENAEEIEGRRGKKQPSFPLSDISAPSAFRLAMLQFDGWLLFNLNRSRAALSRCASRAESRAGLRQGLRHSFLNPI